MKDDVIPYDVQQFLLRYIDSIAQWEGLLLLYSHPNESFKTDDIARHLYISEMETSALLAPLVARNLISVSAPDPISRYHYEPTSPELDDLIQRSAALYKQYLIAITHLIHSKSKSRIQEFADAFKLKKD